MKLVDCYSGKEFIIEDRIDLENGLKEIFIMEELDKATASEVCEAIEDYAYYWAHNSGKACGLAAYLGEGEFFKLVS